MRLPSGSITQDLNGKLDTIDWRGFMIGLQYYLPPKGRIELAGNFTQGESSDLTAENGFVL